uniref:Uncharacterized protein n=1 Tax=Kalanchoe fedtschenkoi TaxID=63787 RepID=A0A7N0VHQ0_KALFE
MSRKRSGDELNRGGAPRPRYPPPIMSWQRPAQYTASSHSTAAPMPYMQAPPAVPVPRFSAAAAAHYNATRGATTHTTTPTPSQMLNRPVLGYTRPTMWQPRPIASNHSTAMPCKRAPPSITVPRFSAAATAHTRPTMSQQHPAHYTATNHSTASPMPHTRAPPTAAAAAAHYYPARAATTRATMPPPSHRVLNRPAHGYLRPAHYTSSGHSTAAPMPHMRASPTAAAAAAHYYPARAATTRATMPPPSHQVLNRPAHGYPRPAHYTASGHSTAVPMPHMLAPPAAAAAHYYPARAATTRATMPPPCQVLNRPAHGYPRPAHYTASGHSTAVQMPHMLAPPATHYNTVRAATTSANMPPPSQVLNGPTRGYTRPIMSQERSVHYSASGHSTASPMPHMRAPPAVYAPRFSAAAAHYNTPRPATTPRP